MSGKITNYKYKTLTNVAVRLRDDLNDHHFVLLYAFNGTGKPAFQWSLKIEAKSKRKIL